jgi:hypothetical protein
MDVSLMHKCDEAEHALVAEYFQRCFDQPLVPAAGNSPAT